MELALSRLLLHLNLFLIVQHQGKLGALQYAQIIHTLAVSLEKFWEQSII
jgi:hypothetical protein